MESNWEFSHIGLVVKDLNKTLDYFESLGVFTIPSREPQVSEGKKAKVIGVHVYLGPLWIEVWQPVSGDTVQQQFLDIHGEGINHVGFKVPDVQEARNAMAEKGIPVAFHIRDRATYYDTDEYGNMLIELLEGNRAPERGQITD